MKRKDLKEIPGKFESDMIHSYLDCKDCFTDVNICQNFLNCIFKIWTVHCMLVISQQSC